MKVSLKMLGAAIPAIMLMSSIAQASSHREAPAISDDPAADNTDLYAWVTPGTRDKVNIVANYIPLEEPAGGPNFHKFSDDVLYEIHVGRGTDNLEDKVTYRISFQTSSINYVDPQDQAAGPGGGKEFFVQLSGQQQTYTISKLINGRRPKIIAQGIRVAPVRIGPRSYTLTQKGSTGIDSYNDAYAKTYIHNMGAEGRVWAGPRDDAFYVDLGGVFDLANLRAKGSAQDGVAGFNVHSIVFEVPTTQLTADGKIPTTGGNASTLGIWASASRKKVRVLTNAASYDGYEQNFGPWVQVSRQGLPLINELIIGLQDKDKWNRSHPRDEVRFFGAYFLNPVIVRDAEAVGIYAALGVDPTPLKFNRVDILNAINLKNIPTTDAHNIPLEATGDVLRLDVGYDSGFPNGRQIPGNYPNREQADVTDVLVSLVLAGNPAAGLGDGVDYNDKDFLTEMPWQGLPWQGFDEGHGKTTP